MKAVDRKPGERWSRGGSIGQKQEDTIAGTI